MFVYDFVFQVKYYCTEFNFLYNDMKHLDVGSNSAVLKRTQNPSNNCGVKYNIKFIDIRIIGKGIQILIGIMYNT